MPLCWALRTGLSLLGSEAPSWRLGTPSRACGSAAVSMTRRAHGPFTSTIYEHIKVLFLLALTTMAYLGTGWQREGQVWPDDGKARSRATKFAILTAVSRQSTVRLSGSCNPEAGPLGRPDKTHWCFSFLCFTVKCISYLKKQPQRTDKPNRSGRLGIRILFF